MDSPCPTDRGLMGWIYNVVLSKYHQFAINTVEVCSRPLNVGLISLSPDPQVYTNISYPK